MSAYQNKPTRFATRNSGLLSKALRQTDNVDAPFKLSGRYDNRDVTTNREEKTDQAIRASGLMIDIDGRSRDSHAKRTTSPKEMALNLRTHESDSVFKSPEEASTPFYIPPGYHEKRRMSDNSILSSIQEDDRSSLDSTQPSLNSTQQLKSGFFRTIKRQYPLLGGMGLTDNSADSGNGDSLPSDDGSPDMFSETDDAKRLEKTSSIDDENTTFMTSMARSRLAELRKVDPAKFDVATGLQLIRLELHEMREQDKSLFLQLIKLHSAIKELRSELNFVDNDSECSYDDIPDATTLWWPRYSTTSRPPNFSSSDGAQFIRRHRHPELRRGYSFNQQRPPPPRLDSYFSAMSSVTDDRASYRSSASSVRSATAI